jgi:hypothetical protein
MQRPTGVTIIAVLDFIGAALCVILGLLMFAGGAMIGSLFNAAATANGATGTAPVGGFMAGIGIFAGVFFLFFAVLAIFIAIGLLKLKNWARVTTIVLSALGLLSTLSRFLHGFAGGGMVVTIIVLAYYIWVIWYMLQPNVKTAFGQPA